MTEYEQRSGRFTAIEDQYAGYAVYDPEGSKIGKVDDLFLDENDQPEYIGVKMSFLGTSSTLIPMDTVTVARGRGHLARLRRGGQDRSHCDAATANGGS